MAADDKVALVTGASRGIGRAIALALGREGFRLALVARTGPELDEVARELESDGGEALSLACDVTDPEAVALAVRRAVERFSRLDVLVNNAGVVEGQGFRDVQVEEIGRVLDVTLRGTIVATRHALPYLLQHAEGAAVVNVGSLAGRQALRGAAVYSAAKHGVLGFADSLFENVRETGLKVCTILPGFVDTPRVSDATELERSRMISPEDVADAVLWALGASPRTCPTEIVLRPQRSPFRA